MYKKRLVCLTHKAYYESCSQQIANTIEKCSNIRDTLDNKKLRVSKPSSGFGRSSFKHISAIGLNSLPETLKTFENYGIFKEQLGFLSAAIGQISFNKTTSILNKDLDNFKDFLTSISV